MSVGEVRAVRPDSAEPAVSRFLETVWMEQGLSPNNWQATA